MTQESCNASLIYVKNVTITLGEEVARWARIAAAEKEVSLSRYVGDLLRQEMTRRSDYEQAMREYLSMKPTGGIRGRKLPRREDVHDRASLRRQ